MPLNSLPTELLHAIYSYCNLREIQRLRLTARTIRDVADEHLFREVTVRFNRGSLDTIAEIATNRPTLAKRIRLLRFRAERYAVLLSFENWNRARLRYLEAVADQRFQDLIKKALTATRRSSAHRLEVEDIDSTMLYMSSSIIPVRDNLSISEARACYREYKSIVEDEETLLSERHIENVFLAIFEHCPNLTSIEFKTRSSWRATDVPNHCGEYQSALLPPASNSAEGEPGVATMSQLLKAAQRAQFSLRRLSLHEVAGTLFPLADESTHLWQNLEKFHWEFATPWDDDADFVDEEGMSFLTRHLNEGHLASVLSHAHKLQDHLELTWEHLEDFPELSRVLGNTVWPRLKSLSLATMQMEAHQLARLLLSHSSTLQELQLGAMCLKDSTWPKCFETFAGKLPTLASAQLWGSFTDPDMYYEFGHEDEPPNDYGNRIAGYIRCGGDKFPEEELDDE